MKQTKKAISLMLAVIVLLSMCSFSALADSITEMKATKGIEKITAKISQNSEQTKLPKREPLVGKDYLPSDLNGERFEPSSVKATPVADKNFAGGTGAKDDPYLISNASQLIYFCNKVNSGTSYEGLYLKSSPQILR